MKTTSTNLIAIVSLVILGLAASTASAGGNKKGGFSISFGGGNFNHNLHHNNHVKKVYVVPKTVVTCYRPFHRFCWVLPGDTWQTIALREYGNAGLCHYLASYNRLGMNTVLYAGQQILLPEIYSNGTMTASFAPIPAPFVVAAPFVPSVPVANIRPATEEPALANVAIGSMLVLDGQSFGEAKGIVRLRVSNLALPVEVLEWSATSAKIRLPELELAGSTQAEIEVVRADGSLASKTAVRLLPAATNLAQGN
jgi:hypothetical protein